MEAQKTNEEIVKQAVEEFEFIFTPIYKFAPADTKTFKENSSEWMHNKLTFILTLKDEAHKKEMEELVKRYTIPM